MAIQGYKVLIKGQSSVIALTDEPTTASVNKVYQITNTAKRILDADTPIVVKVGGVQTTEPYKLNRLEGKVEFYATATRVVTISGGYVALTTIAEANDFGFDGVLDLHDATVFQNENREFMAGKLSASAKIGGFYNIGMLSWLLDKSTKLIEFYPDGVGNVFRFYAVPTGDSITAGVDGLIEESLSFSATNNMLVEV